MPSFPSSALSTLRPDLAGAMMEFDLQSNINGFVGLQIAPVMEVASQLGNWGRIPAEELLKTQDDTRAPSGRYKRGQGKFEPDTYITVEHGFEEAVDDRESNMYANYFDQELVSAMRARHVVLQNFETRIITAALAITNTGNGAVAWTSPASATPIDDVRAGLDTMFTRIGGRVKMAKMVMSWRRFQFLRDCAQIIDRVKSSGLVNPQRGQVNAQMVADALGVSEIILAGSVSNTANEGAAAAAGAPTLASLWTDTKALLFVPPQSNDPREVAFMRTFHWGADGSNIGSVIETYRDETVRGDVVRCRMDTHEKVTYAEAGQIIANI